jgi:hypothetical protein
MNLSKPLRNQLIKNTFTFIEFNFMLKVQLHNKVMRQFN